MIPQLSGACYAVRSVFCTTPVTIYFAYFHSLIKYGILGGGGNSSNSGKIFI